MNTRKEGDKQNETTSANESISLPNEETTPIFLASFPSNESNNAAIKIKWQAKTNSPFWIYNIDKNPKNRFDKVIILGKYGIEIL